jgi:hypothetical protein
MRGGTLARLETTKAGMAKAATTQTPRSPPTAGSAPGDLAARNHLGFISLVGRMKDVTKSGGYSVYMIEFEEDIAAHPAGSPCRRFRPAAQKERRNPGGRSRTASRRASRQTGIARLVPPKPRRLQSPVPNLDSSSRAPCPGTRPAKSSAAYCASSIQTN